MGDLISREAAIAKVKKARKAARTLTGMDFVMMLEELPSVEAIPIDWIKAQIEDAKKFPILECETIVGGEYLIRQWRKEQKRRGT